MGGGIIMIVAIGIQDVFITGDPQITFFKVLYRRHTNFSIEPIEQKFNTNNIRFGQKVSCTVSRSGDLINKIYLVLDLPIIPPFIDKNSCNSLFKFAWVRKIGFALIKTVEIEIGGQLIDRQYGEWLYIWDELTNSRKFTGTDKMIGNVSELTSFTNGKGTYRLYIPLQFWFCKYPGLALPIAALQYNEVKINVEFQNQEKCYLIGPTQSIQTNNSVIHLQPGEWIQQKIGSQIAYGIFMSFDFATGIMYYIRATDQPFQGFDQSSVNNFSGVNLSEFSNQYIITGLCSGFQVQPTDNAKEQNIKPILPSLIEKMVFIRCVLDVEYIYLDTDERFRFINTAHEYLIEQVQLAGTKNIQDQIIQINLGLNHPCRALFWVAQLGTTTNINDTFNFTNSIVRDIDDDSLCGSNLITSSQIMLNSVDRFSIQPGTYFNWIQPHQYFSNDPEEGINVYSFGLAPELYQTSGTCNMSKMDITSLIIGIDPTIQIVSNSFVRIYGLSYNILRIINGIGGLLFSN